ncbi:hypothetical protein NEH16_21900 [Streptomyces drozdowiczii]|uniref:Uncharacterized protein n=2 Tax=Streptomyces drozdowiczii TaxID=202862 RepID=A0ABY6PVM2_9ACTN|nr:hypothetical protein [Streptomyces drozdowiczii]UZK56390.1 hypothetical protein NEH16_21900 [Streptomyces drozdowiczii]
MRRPARLVTGTAAAALAAAALGLSAAAPSAYGDETAPLRITPASAAPGATVTVDTTACGGDSAATGDASALDAPEFPLAPVSLEEALAGSFRVPGSVAPGSYGIGVDCANGKKATGEIEVKAAGSSRDEGAEGTEDAAGTADSPAYDFSDIEGLGGDEDTEGLDGLDAEAAGSGLVPDAPAEAGRTTPTERPAPTGRPTGSSDWDDSGSGRETPSGHRTSAAPTAPSGHVKTGVGGSVGPDTTQIAAGAGVLAAAAVGGAWLLRRRASGTRDAG